MIALKARFPHKFINPVLEPSAWIAPGAQVSGDVHLGAESSVWFNAVIRGDVNLIRIGSQTNIQDLSMVHVSHETAPTYIGNGVTVGHSVILHGCTVGNFSLIGMGSVVLDGSEIGDFVFLGAGSLVTPKTKIPSGMKAYGRPAKVVGPISDKEREFLIWSADHYVNLRRSYLTK